MILPKGITLAALVAYLPLMLVATLWIRFFHDQRPVELLFSSDSLWSDGLLGIGVATATLVFSVVASRFFNWAKDLEREFQSFLGPITIREVGWLALLSSLAEEVFFRGALQQTIGLVPAAIVFGLAHIGPGPKFLPWTLFATSMGLVLGFLFQSTGNLFAPLLAHFLINLVNLTRIITKPSHSSDRSFPPRLPRRDDSDDDQPLVQSSGRGERDGDW
ncbi:MAG: type II CAAX endopeptidase family protein [Planctomycetota bacterium]